MHSSDDDEIRPVDHDDDDEDPPGLDSDSIPNPRCSQASKRSPPPSSALPVPDIDDVDNLLSIALQLPKRHPWVAEYLFHDDDQKFNLPQLICGIQKASAALIEVSLDEATKSLLPQSLQLIDTPSANKMDGNQCCLIPILSRDNITLGILVHRTTDMAASSDSPYQTSESVAVTDEEQSERQLQKEPMTCAKIAYNNLTTALITVVISPDDASEICLNAMWKSVEHSLQICTFSFRADLRDRFLNNESFEEESLRELVERCIVHSERRERCERCHKIEDCRCEFGTNVPSHPLDYSVFARNIVLFAGAFSASVRIWIRNVVGLVQAPTPESVRCDVKVTVNHESVSELCDLAIAQIGETSPRKAIVESRGGSRVTTSVSGQMDSLDSGQSDAAASTSFAQTGWGLSQGTVGFHSGRTANSASLRKIRNREAAARSNQKRKQKVDGLKASLAEAHNRLERLMEEERLLRMENEQLRKRVSQFI